MGEEEISNFQPNNSSNNKDRKIATSSNCTIDISTYN